MLKAKSHPIGKILTNLVTLSTTDMRPALKNANLPFLMHESVIESSVK
jgi:hypothetical protein